MNTVELVNSINEWATNQGLVAKITGEDFISIVCAGNR